MTTIELLAYCRAQEPEPPVPDLVWQHEMHRDENLKCLCDNNGIDTPSGFHDMYTIILEPRHWLIARERIYATVLFTEPTKLHTGPHS